MSLRPAGPVPGAFARRAPFLWTAFLLAAVLLLAVLALLPAAPAFLSAVQANSGEAQYLGAQLLHGSLPYRDVWTNQAPAYFLVNALGQALSGGGRWGVWVLEVIAAGASGLGLYLFLQRFFGRTPAAFAALAFLANLVFVDSYGNQPEAFALPLQVAILLLLVKTLAAPRSNWRSSILIGIALGISTSFKLTLFGTGLVAAGCITASGLWCKNRRRVLDLLAVGAGFLLVWAGWGAFFLAQHALPELWDQAFRYNLLFSGVTNTERIKAVTTVMQGLYNASGFYSLGMLVWLVVPVFLWANDERFSRAVASRWAGLVFLALGVLLGLNGLLDDRTARLVSFSALTPYRLALTGVGLVCACAALLFFLGLVERFRRFALARWKPGSKQPGSKQPGSKQPGTGTDLLLPLGIGLAGLPVEVALASLPGRADSARYIPLLIPLSIIVAFLAWMIGSARVVSADRFHARAWLAALALPVMATGWFVTFQSLQQPEPVILQPTVDFIQSSTRPGQLILQWGADERLYLPANRQAATRYASQLALFTPGYTSPAAIQRFLTSLQQNPPNLIIDTRSARIPLVLVDRQNCAQLSEATYFTQTVRAERDAHFPDAAARNDPLAYMPMEMKSVYRWICENYTIAYAPDPDPGGDPDPWRVYRFQPQQP